MSPSVNSSSKQPGAGSNHTTTKPAGVVKKVKKVKVQNHGLQIKKLAAILGGAHEPAEPAEPAASSHSPPSSTRTENAVLHDPKRKKPDAPISHPQQAMGTIDPEKGTKTTIIDGMVARRVEVIGIEAKKKQKVDKKEGGVPTRAKGADGVKKPRFYKDKHGEIKLRKKRF